MVARATAPNKVGPESVFPDAAKWDFQDGLKGAFFLALTIPGKDLSVMNYYQVPPWRQPPSG